MPSVYLLYIAKVVSPNTTFTSPEQEPHVVSTYFEDNSLIIIELRQLIVIILLSVLYNTNDS